MYRKIYQILEETGKVKTAMILNGIHKGAKCMIRENQCISLNDGEAQEFWKDYQKELAAAPGLRNRSRLEKQNFLLEIYVKNPQAYYSGRRSRLLQPVAKIGKMLGFHVTVMDDREELC